MYVKVRPSCVRFDDDGQRLFSQVLFKEFSFAVQKTKQYFIFFMKFSFELFSKKKFRFYILLNPKINILQGLFKYRNVEDGKIGD